MKATEWAFEAITGNHDEPKTWCALILALDGTLHQFDDLVGKKFPSGETDWVKMARIFDGLDGEEIVQKLRAAIDTIDLLNKALNGSE